MFLVRKINPMIDKICNELQEKIPKRVLKNAVRIITIFLIINCALTCYAQDQFITRMVVENNIPIYNEEEVKEKYNKVKENKSLDNCINKFWGNRKMIKTFPNIKIQDKDFNTIYLNTLLPEIEPFYVKIFEKK